MEKNTIGIGVLFLIVGIGAGYLLWGNIPVTTPYGMYQTGDGSMMARNIDRHFIEEMIPHHEGAIAMAELALEKSKRPEILSLAKAIIEVQTSEITKMKEWYQEWFGAAVPAYSTGAMGGMGHGAGMQMMGMEGDLETLRAAKDFDTEFLQQMIPHHEMAIMMARMLAAGTERPEMQKLADDIITSQSREIDLMRGWLTSWYGN